MIPKFLRPEVVPYASVEIVRMPPVLTQWWVKLRYKASGFETTYVEKSDVNRRILISVVRPYADVVATGER